MKKLTLALLAAALPFMSFAQDSTATARRKEIGLTFSSLSSYYGYGLTYRTGTNKALWRFNLASASARNHKNSIYKSYNRNAELSFGREFRKPIAKRMDLRYGLDLTASYSKQSDIYNDDITRETYGGGLNFVVGVNYIINEHLTVGAEALPNIGFSRGTEQIAFTTKRDISSFNYGFSSSSVLMSIVYKLSK